MARTKTLLAWSSGKDSAYALWALRQNMDVEVVGLLTTLNRSVGRVNMHGVHQSVLAPRPGPVGYHRSRCPFLTPAVTRTTGRQ